MRLVLDASVAVHLIVPSHLQAMSRARIERTELLAPTLMTCEVLSALARLERATDLTPTEAKSALKAWCDLPCEFLPSQQLTEHIWELRGRLRIADAHYVALALALDAPLLTADRRLASAVPPGLAVLLVT